MITADFEDFLYEEFGEVCIETLNFSRATLKETDIFRKRIKDNITNGKKNIIIDLSFCDYCDSSFIGALVVCTKKTGLENVKFAIVVSENSYMAYLIHSTRLDKVLTIFKTRDEALKHYIN
ncbi:MAG: STAS domain-containing protein [Ignavibacteria bacterium]|nr:STAS domain-containing protein [Ignavibacteria bacterium]